MTVRAISIVVDTYPNHPEWDVTAARESATMVADQLAKHGVEVLEWSDTDYNTLRSRLEGLQRRDNVDDDTCHIIYWTGHGEDTGKRYLLATQGSKPALADHAPFSDDALYAILDGEQSQRQRDGSEAWTLLIIDACKSGLGTRRIRSKFAPDQPPANLGIIGTTDDGATLTGRFGRLLSQQLSTGWENETHIPLATLAHRLALRIDPNNVHASFQPHATLPLPEATLTGVTGAVDIQNELSKILADQPAAVRSHFIPRAQGAELNELAWHFRGREKERRDINTWLEDNTGGMLIITGVAGVGKSALLGMVLASTYPQVMAHIQDLGYRVDGAEIIPDGVAFDAVVHLSGIDFAAALAQTAEALEHASDATDIDAFLAHLQGRQGQERLTLLFDALDESHDPFTIASGLLRRLSTIPGVRVLLGTRRSLGEDPDNPEITAQNLISVLKVLNDSTTLIELEPDKGAVESYSRDRLQHNLPNYNFRQLRQAAKNIAAADQPFLFARLAIHEISRAPGTFLTPGNTGLDDLLAGTHASIFRYAVDRLRRDSPRVEALLHALAYSQGNGYPRIGEIWAIAGSAVLGSELTDVDVEEAINVAAPYILRDAEFGVATYRLAHQTFAEHYHRADDFNAQ